MPHHARRACARVRTVPDRERRRRRKGRRKGRRRDRFDCGLCIEWGAWVERPRGPRALHPHATTRCLVIGAAWGGGVASGGRSRSFSPRWPAATPVDADERLREQWLGLVRAACFRASGAARLGRRSKPDPYVLAGQTRWESCGSTVYSCQPQAGHVQRARRNWYQRRLSPSDLSDWAVAGSSHEARRSTVRHRAHRRIHSVESATPRLYAPHRPGVAPTARPG
jgi:hypothetical protein